MAKLKKRTRTFFTVPITYYIKSIMLRTKKRYTKQEAYIKLSAMCAACEYCRHDMLKKMANWDISEEEKLQVLELLVAERFIDERRFARAFARDKFRYNKWGRVRIAQEMKMRGIASADIDAGLEEIEDNDNLSLLRELINKKRPTVKGKNDFEIKAKLFRYAIGKGFAAEDIAKVISMEDDS